MTGEGGGQTGEVGVSGEMQSQMKYTNSLGYYVSSVPNPRTQRASLPPSPTHRGRSSFSLFRFTSEPGQKGQSPEDAVRCYLFGALEPSNLQASLI